MRYLLAVVFGVMALSVSAADKEFVPLFNGKDLTGWKIHAEKPIGPNHWYVTEGGTLCAKDGWSWLATTKEYKNFILQVEWRVPVDGNSGVFLRVPPDPKAPPHEAGLEVQLLDDQGPQYKGKLQPYQYSGSIYYFAPAKKSMFKGANQWNQFQITCRGNSIQVEYNGEVVTEGTTTSDPKFDARPKKGTIGLQNHGSAVEFRNLKICELPD